MNPTGTVELPSFSLTHQEPYVLDLDRWSKLKREVLELYGDMKGRIPDEVAWELGPDFANVRPRCSALHTEGCLRMTGVRRRARRGWGKELVITERGLLVLQILRAKSDAAA